MKIKKKGKKTDTVRYSQIDNKQIEYCMNYCI